jgi:hypothetical protein
MVETRKTMTPAEIALALAEPFDPDEVHFKPQIVSGNRALAIAYADARTIQDRLDEVLGVDGWQDAYRVLPDGSVICRLRLRLGGEWITKMDVGSQSEQPDGGDRIKAAFSDALKRVAVKFGIGRYLYRLPSQWVDYDPKRKQFTGKPQLPSWAIPGKVHSPPAQPNAAAQDANGSAAKSHTMPADGEELERRLADYDARLAAEGLWVAGDMFRHVVEVVSKAGPKPGYGRDVRTWPERAITLAVGAAKAFEQEARQKEEHRRAAEQRLAAPRVEGTNHQ